MATKNVLFKIQADTSQLRRELDAVQKELSDINKTTKETEKSISSFASVLKQAGTTLATLGIGAGLLEFAKTTFNATAELERLQISFTTFLGSSERAKQVLKDLEDFSISTPFESTQVQNAGRSLLAFGVPAKDLTETLRMLGDISAGTGKDFNELASIFGKAKTQGVVQGEELNQLAEAGVPIYSKLAEVLNIAEGDVRKFGEQGKISFLDLQQALKLLTTEGEKGSFFGLTEQLSTSLTGRLSTLSDEFTKLARDIGTNLKPAFAGAIEGGLQFIEFIRAIPKFVRDNAQVLTILSGVVAFYTAKVRFKTQAQIVDNTILNVMIARERIATALTGLRARTTAFFSNVQKSATAGTLLQTTATAGYNIATQIATATTRAFTTALRSNPIGLLATAISLATAYLIDFGDATENVTDVETERYNSAKALENATLRGNDLLDEERTKLDVLFNQLRKTTNGSKERNDIINKINGQYPTTLKNLKDEKDFQALVNAEYKKAVDFISAKAKSQALEEELVLLYKEQRKQQEVINKNQKDAIGTQEKINEITKKGGLEDVNQQVLKNIATLQNTTQELGKAVTRETAQKGLDVTNKAIDDILKELANIQIPEVKTPAPDTSKTSDAIDKLILSLKEKIESLKFDIAEQQIEFFDPNTLTEAEKQINDIYKVKQLRASQDIKRQEDDARKQGLLTSAVEKEFDQLKLLTKTKLENEANERISKIRKDYAKRDADAQREINKTATDERVFDEETKQQQLENEISDLVEKTTKFRNKRELQLLLEQIEAKRKLIVSSIQSESNARIKLLEQQRNDVLNDTKLTETERLAKTKEIDLQIKQEKQKTNDEITKVEKDGAKEQVDIQKKANDEIIEGIKKVADETIALTNAVIDARIKETENAISMQEKRIERAKEIADKGNAELLQLEEERLDKLNRQRQNYIRVQQALAFTEIAFNSAVAIAKSARDGGGFASGILIASTLIALATGFIKARSLAMQGSGFAEGGFTGNGGKYEPAGIVHKGEFVFSKEKTTKYRSLFEDIHKGREPFLTKGLTGKLEFVASKGMDEKLTRIEKAIREQKGMSLSIDERGIHGIVSQLQYKQNRIRNKAR